MAASSSPTASPASTHNALTPSRKVQALLEGLSDSEPDNNSDGKLASAVSRSNIHTQESSSEDDILPRSRIANRLAGKGQMATQQPSLAQEVEAPAEKGSLVRDEDMNARTADSQTEQQTPAFAPTRRLLNKRKSSPIHVSRDGSPRSRTVSPSHTPLSSASHTSTRSSPNHATNNTEAVNSPPADGKAKFLALVEKHRKERLAREAEEIMKKSEANSPEEEDAEVPARRLQRGSSPADDSAEDSDVSVAGAAKKLSREARPTRKASKKALEEMNRETQRISRNMQLTHQTKTKKKITKESLLARFNFVSSDKEDEVHETNDKSTTASSAPTSETEKEAFQGTPPTSPLQEPSDKPAEVLLTNESEAIIPPLDSDDEADSFSLNKAHKQKLVTIEIEENTLRQAPQSHSLSKPEPSDIPLMQPQVLSMRAIVQSGGDLTDSDSDLEVVTEKGLRRKYVAFESLPKRKAKEAPSHLALRSLANLMGDEKKRMMNSAEMESKLRRAARQQAKEERQAKIEMLKAKGVIIQTAEEREREQQEVEDLVERARQEAVEIQKREKALAKKDGTFVKDALDDSDESDDEDDEDFRDAENEEQNSESGEDDQSENEDETSIHDGMIDDAAEDGSSEEESTAEADDDDGMTVHEHPEHDSEHGDLSAVLKTPATKRPRRNLRVVSDDEDEAIPTDNLSPALPSVKKTPQSVLYSARKVIPGLQMSDDLPLGLTQAFAATMADSQTQEDDAAGEQESLDMMRSLPSPSISTKMPGLRRLSSIDVISESVPASQTQPLDVQLSMTQADCVPESPSGLTQIAISEAAFDLTQDAGYSFSPFLGSRFSETPKHQGAQSNHQDVYPTAGDGSPLVQRKGRLVRGKTNGDSEAEENVPEHLPSAFNVMQKAAKKKALQAEFDRKRSHARGAVDEAAEESDDEYAGLGGASDEDSDEEANEEDRRMIDEDTQVGYGDEAKLAKLHADRERQSDEAAVSKLLKDITTGALRRKRGAGDDLDLSDEEDAVARRREAKRREFAKMRRELLKDEAVNKIAEDKRKEAFLRSIEDREEIVDDDNDFDKPEAGSETDSQSQVQRPSEDENKDNAGQTRVEPLRTSRESRLNQRLASHNQNHHVNRKPATLAEIRESVSFLVEEPDSQSATIDLGLSDSEDEPEAYVNLDRHFKEAEADENAFEDEDAEDLGDFIVDDDGNAKDSQDELFKKPDLPARAPFNERRTKNTAVIDRLSLIRQASSSSSNSSTSSKMAFFTATSTNLPNNRVPNLLRRATTNSSLGSMSGRDVSATGVTTNKTERGSVSEEKEFIRKGNKTSRNAVNFQGRTNVSLREEKMSARAGVNKSKAKGKKTGGGFLGGLFNSASWS